MIASPKSALILNVTVWDDAAGNKLNDKPEQVTVIESFSGETVLGSGLTQSKEEQLTNLSRNAAKLVQNWLVRQKFQENWFGGTAADREQAKAVVLPAVITPAESTSTDAATAKAARASTKAPIAAPAVSGS